MAIKLQIQLFTNPQGCPIRAALIASQRRAAADGDQESLKALEDILGQRGIFPGFPQGTLMTHHIACEIYG